MVPGDFGALSRGIGETRPAGQKRMWTPPCINIPIPLMAGYLSSADAISTKCGKFPNIDLTNMRNGTILYIQSRKEKDSFALVCFEKAVTFFGLSD